jgi:hypothetical protein
MYKNMSPEEKATWEAKAAQDKARFDAEIASYAPPPGHDAKGVLIDSRPPRKKQKRPPKDPAAPKRASGAYVFFTNFMRPQVMSEYPGIKFVELGKVLGERWRALTPEQKKQYEDLAAHDKARFQMEMEHYAGNQTHHHRQRQLHDASAAQASSASVDGLALDGHEQHHQGGQAYGVDAPYAAEAHYGAYQHHSTHDPYSGFPPPSSV